METTDGDISLAEVFNFCLANWKIVIGAGIVSLLLAYVYLSSIPLNYKANALVHMAQNQGNNIENPDLVIERLKQPTTYSPESIKACGLQDNPFATESLSSIVKANTIPKLPAVLEISVTRSSPEEATECISKVYDLIQSYQAVLMKPYEEELQSNLKLLQNRLNENQAFITKMEKAGLFRTIHMSRRDETLYLIMQIEELKHSLLSNSSTRLIAPVYASANAIKPDHKRTYATWTIAGLLLGLFIALSKKVLSK